MKHSFNSARVNVKQGLLQGIVQEDLKAFLGVPYAAPPLGNLRWRAPEPPARWFGTRSADRMSGGALQADGRENWPTEDFELSAKMDSEDCLYLNVWTPAKNQDEKLPVYVWVHGGGMVAGTGMASFFEGDELARQGVVVASINYRLGLFGFMCHPELSNEADYKSSGNYALLDMRQALLWLRENIAQFGGDPDNITVGGQSGGSVGTSCILMSPLTKGLCRRVVLESGCPMLGGMMDPKSLDEMEKDGLDFAKKLGGKSLEELRKMDGCDLIEESLKHRFIPNYCVDGYFLPDAPNELFTSGRFNDMGILAGFTSEEFGSFNLPKDISISADAFESYINSIFPKATAKQLLALYDYSTPKLALKALLRLQGDLMFISALRLGEAAAKKDLPVYIYYKTRPDPGERGESFGSTHSSELPYLFGRHEPCIINPAGMNDEEKAFGRELVNYWISFIKTGSPNNGGNSVEWPLFKQPYTYLDLGNSIHAGTEEESRAIRLLNDLLCERNENTARPYMNTDALGYPKLFSPF